MPSKHSDASALAPLLDGSTDGELIPELVRHCLQQLIELEVAAVLGADRPGPCLLAPSCCPRRHAVAGMAALGAVICCVSAAWGSAVPPAEGSTHAATLSDGRVMLQGFYWES